MRRKFLAGAGAGVVGALLPSKGEAKPETTVEFFSGAKSPERFKEYDPNVYALRVDGHYVSFHLTPEHLKGDQGPEYVRTVLECAAMTLNAIRK